MQILAARHGLLVLALASLGRLSIAAPADDITPHAGMLRYPDVSGSQIVFVYANDLWVVSRDGGVATPLASPPGQELFPRFSPDGQTIAFQGNYDGDRDIYTIAVTGGSPTRVTHHPGNEFPTEWTPDGRILFFMSGLAGLARQTQIFSVAPEGGLPEQLPIPYGANGTISPDGQWLAYTPWTRDFRTWKRYRGGMASDVWLFNLESYESKKITDWEGTDTLPMWHGKNVYYLSDAGPEHRLNIWVYGTDSGQNTQVTEFADYDVKFPSVGPGRKGRGEIVFQNGSSLYLLDLRSKKSEAVQVTIPGDRPKIRSHMVDASKNLAGGGISSTGKRAVVEARGDIWTVPAEHGPVRHITDSSGSAERSPAWSPDGRWIAYFSDADGEYELYVTQSDGKEEPRQVTDGNTTFFYSITWSPDSKSVLLIDKAGNIILVDVESGEATVVDRDEWANQPSVDWSHDSKWIVYDKADPDSLVSAVWLYDVEKGEKHRLTGGFFNDGDPVFDRKGEFLYYVSSRSFSNPKYEDIGQSFIYDNTGKLIAVPLNTEVENPRQIKSDEETWKDEEAADKDDEADKDNGEGKDGGDGDEEDKGDGGDDADKGDAGGNDDGDADGDSGDDAADDAKKAPDEKATEPASPIHGVWSGTAKGLSALGLPEDELEFTMTIIAHEDGSFTGKSTSMGETNDYDSVEFDEETGAFTASRVSNGLTTILKGTLSGEKLTGTWQIKELDASGTWEATRTSTEVDEEEAESDKAKEIKIDLEGFESRGMELPVPPGRFSNLASNDKGQLLYVRAGAGPLPPSIKLVDIRDDKPEEKNVLTGAGGFDISGDGKKIIAMVGGKFGIVGARLGQSISKPLRTTGLNKTVDPPQEWDEIFTDAWRRHRDFFYVQNMHGVDWDAVYDRYHAMLADAASREDVSFIIGEMISELNVGHAYYFGGDLESQPSRSVGLLGADFEIGSETGEDGNTVTAYRIARIVHGAPWDSDARGPLNQPGIDVEEGDYVLAVNGRPIDTSRDPWAAFEGLVGRDTIISVADALVGDDEARNERDITIKPLGSESALRYRAWVEDNRRYVQETSSGRVGYIHVPDTGVNGQNELFRQFYGQIGKEALIIDERWNGGGQIPTRFIELLNRPRTNYWARRDGKDWPWPPDSHQGPKCMLINGLAGSGGDMFPWLFRFNKLGKLIGMRTWGGLVGISRVPGLIDGGYTSVPNFGFYEKDGTWGIEGHGVDPDIEVVDDPTELARGNDPQLDVAIQEMLDEIGRNGYHAPKRPASPNRSGMGVNAEDR